MLATILTALAVLVAAAVWALEEFGDNAPRPDAPADVRFPDGNPRPHHPDDGGIGELFANRRSDVVVTAAGHVSRMLADDHEGSRHQRFLVELPGGVTVLVAHNIDLADRVPCGVGDVVRFRGEYEWSEKGGTIHWTHHDPQGRHEDGWVEHEGKRYGDPE